MKKKRAAYAAERQEPDASATEVEALSREELELLRASIAGSGPDRSQLPPHDTSDRATVLRFAKRNKLLTALLIFVALSLLAGLIVGGVLLYKKMSERPSRGDFTIQLVDVPDPITAEYGYLVRDGVLYLDLNQLAPYAGLTVSGSDTRLRFSAGNEYFFQFEHESEYALINGDTVEIEVPLLDKDDKLVSAKVYIEDGACLVPYRFLTASVKDGLLFRLDRKENVFTIKREYEPREDEDDHLVGVQILFSSADFTVIPPETEPPKYTYTYLIDMTDYLDSVSREYLLLANKQTPLNETYVPSDLEELTVETANNRIFYLRADAVRALEAMMAEMHADGVTDIYVTSAYRSYKRQYELFFETYYPREKAKHPDWTDEQLYAEVATYSAYPGTSEHQTGLCVDFMTSTMIDLNNTFADTNASAWLRENAYKFGFILRYPEDKVDVTQYSYESWHYRFVGRDAASDIHFEGICLEEYLGVAEDTARAE